MILYKDTLEEQIETENQIKNEIENTISEQEVGQLIFTDEVEKLAKQSEVEEEVIKDKYGLHEIYIKS